jgi:hypothetical protein
LDFPPFRKGIGQQSAIFPGDFQAFVTEGAAQDFPEPGGDAGPALGIDGVVEFALKTHFGPLFGPVLHLFPHFGKL